MSSFVENFKKAVTEILKEDYHYYGDNLAFLGDDNFSDIEPSLDDYDLKDFFKDRKKDPADKVADHEDSLERQRKKIKDRKDKAFAEKENALLTDLAERIASIIDKHGIRSQEGRAKLGEIEMRYPTKFDKAFRRALDLDSEMDELDLGEGKVDDLYGRADEIEYFDGEDLLQKYKKAYKAVENAAFAFDHARISNEISSRFPDKMPENSQIMRMRKNLIQAFDAFGNYKPDAGKKK